MATSLVGALGAKHPDSAVLFDDTFDTGFMGWQELHNTTTAPFQVTPLSLGPYAQHGSRSLRLQTYSATDQGYGSQAVAMKRLGYHYDVTALTTVDFEVWFSFGSENTSGMAPRYIQFMIDEMRGGTRHFWKWRWRQTDQATRTLNWYLSSQGEDTYVDTTYTSDLTWNGNKGSINYCKFTLDLSNRAYQSIYANGATYDLTTVAGVTAPGANGSQTFDDPYFNNGLNFMLAIINRSSTSTTAAWMDVSRVRASVR